MLPQRKKTKESATSMLPVKRNEILYYESTTMLNVLGDLNYSPCIKFWLWPMKHISNYLKMYKN